MSDPLRRSTPGQEGVRADGISSMVRAAEELDIALHSLMIARHGAVVAEGWWAPYSPEHRQMVFSVSKSVTATAIGIAQDEGLLTVEDHLIDYFPALDSVEYAQNVGDMRIRHLLSMSTGHDVDTMEIMRALPREDWTKIFMGVPVVFPPGTHFLYNSGASYMLSAIVTVRTGKSPREYLRDRLWAPLGIDDPPWESSPAGVNLGASGIRLTTEELLKLGLLYLQGGLWGSSQVVSQAWVTQASSLQVENGDGSDDDWSQGYGFQIWRSRHDSYRFDGRYGQFVFIMPKYDAVVAITAGTSDSRSVPALLWDHLVPAFGDTPVEENAAMERMRRLLETRSVRIPRFRSVDEVERGAWSSTINLPFNTLHVSQVQVELAGDRFVMRFGTVEGQVETHHGSGSEWSMGQTRVWPHEEMTSVTAFTIGGFTQPNRLEVHQQLTDTPFRRTWTFEFSGGDEVLVSVGLDNGFWVDRTEILEGKRVPASDFRGANVSNATPME